MKYFQERAVFFSPWLPQFPWGPNREYSKLSKRDLAIRTEFAILVYECFFVQKTLFLKEEFAHTGEYFPLGSTFLWEKKMQHVLYCDITFLWKKSETCERFQIDSYAL